MHDAVIGDGDFLDVLLGGGVARDGRVVEPVHTHGDGAGTLDVGLLQQDHSERGILLLDGYRSHRASGATTDHEHVGIDYGDVVDGCSHG